MSSIEWTDETWNPTRGCSRVSAGCDNCYAMRMARRSDLPGGAYEGLTRRRKSDGAVDWSGRVRLVPEQLDKPLRWRKPRMVFVNSMSDLFHESLSNEEIAAVFGVMAARPWHTFQVLTKRAKREREWFEWVDRDGEALHETIWQATSALGRSSLDPPLLRGWGNRWPLKNVWLGVSAEDQQRADERIPQLLHTPAAVRFVSAEPLLSPVDLSIYLYRGVEEATPGDVDYDALNWVIVGGESGPGARRCDTEWIRSIRDQCRDAGVACFVKQLGSLSVNPEFGTPALTNRKGGNPSEWPADLRVRQFPEVP